MDPKYVEIAALIDAERRLCYEAYKRAYTGLVSMDEIASWRGKLVQVFRLMRGLMDIYRHDPAFHSMSFELACGWEECRTHNSLADGFSFTSEN